MNMTKKKAQAATKVQIPVFQESITVATVTSAEASNMLDRLNGFQRAARQNTLAAMTEAYRIHATGATLVSPKYKDDGALGTRHAISDLLNGPQGVAESAEQYTIRWMKSKSTVYNYIRAGWLLSFLSERNWLDECSIRPHWLCVIAQIVGHASMGGDAEKTCAVAVDLINAVEAGKIPDIGTLRDAVRKVLGKDADAQIKDTMTIVISLKVSGLTEEQVKMCRESGRVSVQSMAVAMGGKLA